MVAANDVPDNINVATIEVQIERIDSLSHKVAADAAKTPLQQRGMPKAMEILHCGGQAGFLGGRRGTQASVPPTTTPP